MRSDDRLIIRCCGTRSHHSVDITHVKPKLHRRRRRIYGSFQSRRRRQKLFFGRFITNWQVIDQLHLQKSRDKKLQNELNVEQKKGHQPYYCNLDWMKSGGQIPWNAITMQNVQNFLTNGKSQIWTKIWGIIQRTNHTIWLIGWISPKTQKNKNSSIWKEITTRNFVGYASFAGRNLGRRYSDYWCWRIGKFGVIETYSRRPNTKEVLITHKDREFVFPETKWFSYIIRKKLRIPRIHSETGIHRKEREAQRRISWRQGRVSTGRNKRWRRNTSGFFGLFKEISFIVILLNREFNCTCREKNHTLFHWVILISSGQLMIERNSFERVLPTREEIDETSNETWRIDKNWESRSKKTETRMSNRETAYSMQKIVFLNMRTGNRCSKK